MVEEVHKKGVIRAGRAAGVKTRPRKYSNLGAIVQFG